MSFLLIVGIIIFVAVYITIISDKVHRTIVAVLGGMLMISLRIVPKAKAFHYVDWNVIFLLIGMMILVGAIQRTGLLQYMAIKGAKIARGNPYATMSLLILITALFSAFLDNVTTVVLIAPVSILIAVELGISPVPFLISEALASNVGGTATLIGDPPNIIIGSAANLGFMDFIKNMTPPIILMILILPIIMKWMMGKRMVVSYERKARIMEFDTSQIIEDPVLLKKSLIVFSLVIIGFFIHSLIDVDVSVIAMLGAFSLLLILKDQRKMLRELLSQIEWTTLFFFMGFFIMVGGLLELGVIDRISYKLFALFKNNLSLASLSILWSSGILSSILDNIPFVTTMTPVVKALGTQWGAQTILPIWWSLALGACLGGNMTLIGAAANVVVADISERNG
ncbi:MAG: ArsB/NhaD family transporter, partial [Caldiserica bacterium]|nr:ArsB/NhaD family transporter [Caldisericota bacterium]